MISRRNIHILVELSMELNKKVTYCTFCLPTQYVERATIGIQFGGFDKERPFDIFEVIYCDDDAEKIIGMMLDLLRGEK